MKKTQLRTRWCAQLSLWIAAAFFFSVTVAVPEHPAHDHGTQQTYKGRVIAPTMSYLGADWLERTSREATQQPEKVLDVLNIRPGSIIADIGAGTGYFSLRLAKRVGAQGRILATDIQSEMLSLLRTNMEKAGLTNIEPILCTPIDAKLPVRQLDMVLMVDVYHELAYPEETLAQVRRALKSDGRFVLIEYRGEDPTLPIKPVHKMTLQQIRSEIEPQGFTLQQTFDFLPQQHFLVFVTKGQETSQ